MILTIPLTDHSGSADGLTVLAHVESMGNGYGLSIRVEGYGTADSADDLGAPIFLEFYRGELRLVLSPDINSEDLQIINLEGARLERRVEE